MKIQATSMNFGHYVYGGECATVTKKAAKFAAEEGQGVVDALKEFTSARQYPDFSYPGNFVQRTVQQFKKPRWAVVDRLDIGVREGKQAASGKDTLTVSSGRFMSGKNFPGATVEVEIPYPPTKEATLQVLENAAKKAREASDRNYSAYVLRNPDAAITEDLTKAAK